MKSVFIILIKIYQIFFSSIIKQIFGVKSVCRYSPSCSEYAKKAILKFGVFKGLKLGTLRLLSCQPFIKVK